MGQVTGIEWCHHTYNAWIGCTKVSPACDHCYAEAQEDRRYGRVEWGGPLRRTSEATRSAPYRCDREAAAASEHRRVFCMSLGDFWDNKVTRQMAHRSRGPLIFPSAQKPVQHNRPNNSLSLR